MWAINVLLFSKAGVDLPELFGRGTSTDYPTAQAILQRIAWIVALGAINVTIFFGLYSWIGEDKWASLLPVLSYIAGVILLVFIFLAKEGDYCYVPFLKYVGEELYQNIVIWSEELPMFRTMFLADILTSTIKVWVDVGSFICQSVCAMAYIWAALSNAFLRCSLLWSYELLKSEKKRVLIMFMLTALEIFRRFQFTVFRVIALLPQQPSPDNGALLPQQPPQDPQDLPNEIEVDTA
ncbi:hypothetical protein Q3G72_012033 [Acer saccharum]|nr:hypothetical protein Q3G72_012033 [Acer saccharum]